MTNTHDPAAAIKARVVGEWSNRHLMAFGPLLPHAFHDVLRILGAHGSVGATVLRRLLLLVYHEHGGNARGCGGALEQLLADLTRPEVPVTLEGMTRALVEMVMDPMTGADILPVDADHNPENWDAVRSARLFTEHGV